MKTKSGLLLALLIILLIVSIITFLYGLGLLTVYLISSKALIYSNSQKKEIKLKFGLTLGFGLGGMLLCIILLTTLYK